MNTVKSSKQSKNSRKEKRTKGRPLQEQASNRQYSQSSQRSLSDRDSIAQSLTNSLKKKKKKTKKLQQRETEDEEDSYLPVDENYQAESM